MTYPTMRLNHVASTRTSNVDKKSYDGEVTVRLCNYTDVYKNNTITSGMDFMVATATQDQIGKFGLKVGDTVFTKDSETANDIGVPAYIADSAHDLICGYHLAIARPYGGVADPRFLYWCLASPEAAQQWSVLASGVTRVGLRQADIGKLEISVPPLQTQRKVAAFLDRETAQIDELIGKQERLIELLGEKRQAMITRAATKGLDPNAHTKPSGIAWLGETPSHWAVQPLKWVSRFTTGITPSTANESNFSDEATSYPWIRPEDLDQSGRPTTASKFLSFEGWNGCRPVRADSVLVCCIGATLGKVGLIREPAVTNQQITAIESEMVGSYLFAALGTARQEIEAMSVGNTLPILNTSRLGMLCVPVPPAPEQVRIAQYIKEKSEQIDRLSERCKAAIALLRERRSALISAAVTGKIAVVEGAA